MSETVYRCHNCGWIQSEEEDDLSCARCGESRSMIEQTEVVPASALKRCEEERDEAYEDSRRSLDRVRRLVAQAERVESAEAKCERLEAIAREFKGRFHGNDETTTAADSRQLVRRRGGEHNEVEFNLAQIEHKIDTLLSTPKTEGER